jgi:isopentenyl-diphosphate delta-isomerase
VLPERVVLVDAADREIGSAEKLEAHARGFLHRAVSVVIFDGRGSMLLQRRAPGKYHSGGLWSNTCCGHPRPGEEALAAARRRLAAEMGIETELSSACVFTYRAIVGPGLVEHEVDHVFLGTFAGAPRPDADEVVEWRWQPSRELLGETARAPERFSAWLEPLLAALAERGLLEGAA